MQRRDAATRALAFAALALAPAPAFAQRRTPAPGSASTAPASTAESAPVTPPRLRHLVEAAYPAEAMRRGEGALVVLRIDVDAQGAVTDVSVAESSGRAIFDEAAVAAARAG